MKEIVGFGAIRNSGSLRRPVSGRNSSSGNLSRRLQSHAETNAIHSGQISGPVPRAIAMAICYPFWAVAGRDPKFSEVYGGL